MSATPETLAVELANRLKLAPGDIHGVEHIHAALVTMRVVTIAETIERAVERLSWLRKHDAREAQRQIRAIKADDEQARRAVERL